MITLKEKWESPQIVTEKAEIGTLVANNGSPIPVGTAPGVPICDD